jgi:PAS domain S-box-containing protein
MSLKQNSIRNSVETLTEHVRINHILASSPAVLYSFAATGDYAPTFISENVREVFGYEPSEYLEDRKFVPDRIHPDDAARVGGDLARLFKKGYLINEYRFRRKDGSYCWVTDQLKVIHDDTGKPVEVIGSWSDISARKEAEAAVAAALARINHILASSPAVLYSFAATGDYAPTFVSENLRDVFGYEPSDYLGDRKFVPDRIHPDDAARVSGDLARLFKKGYLINEYRFRRKDGSYCWVSDELRVVKDAAGKPVEVIGSWSDICARKEAEAAAAEAHARINHILASSPSVLYSFQATGNNNPTFVSENLRDVFGYEPSEYLGDRNFVPARIHPDDTSDVGAGFSRLFKEGHLTNEYRFRRKDGSYCWVSDELRVIKDAAGKPVEIVGSWSDISARKEAEAAVAAVQARINHILASSPAVLYSFQATGNYAPTFISENVLEVFGYEQSEYLEDPNFVPDRIHPDDAARVGDGLSRLFKEGYLTHEYRFRRKDGSYCWVSDELKVIKDDAGKPVEVIGSWSDISARKQVKEKIIGLLKATSLFGSLDESAIRDIAAESNSVQLMGGMQLIQQGDSADSFYLVISGRVRTYVTKDDGVNHPTGEVGRGELVGETAVLTGEPQPESARAIRDTELLQFSKDAFYRLVESHPKAVLLLSKNIAIRYQREIHGTNTSSVISTIAVIPAGHGAPISDFTKRLAAALSEFGSTVHLDVHRIDKALGQESEEKVKEDRILRWLNKREARNQFVIYESTLEPSSWSRRCIRQADRIILVGVAGTNPDLNTIEKEISSQQGDQPIARQELVLLHQNRNKIPSGTIQWLNRRNVANHHHIVSDSTDDYKRLCRFLTGRAISLVLGGGGARGCAHIGLIRAMQELHVPIDSIGGTSIGAAMASCFALGLNPDDILTAIEKFWLIDPLKDYTLPVVSLITGRRLNQALQTMYGDVHAEDLWIKYFSVSANLTRAQTEIHKVGEVWKGVRASMSIPGHIPPIVFNGELHVDGGVLNNLPVDAMREICDGIIIANNVSSQVDMTLAGKNEGTYSGWDYVLNALNPSSKKLEMPGILKILMRAGTLYSVKAVNVSKAMADIYMQPPIDKYELLDLGPAREIEEVGHQYALEVVSKQLHDNELLKKALLI